MVFQENIGSFWISRQQNFKKKLGAIRDWKFYPLQRKAKPFGNYVLASPGFSPSELTLGELDQKDRNELQQCNQNFLQALKGAGRVFPQIAGKNVANLREKVVISLKLRIIEYIATLHFKSFEYFSCFLVIKLWKNRVLLIYLFFNLTCSGLFECARLV